MRKPLQSFIAHHTSAIDFLDALRYTDDGYN
jgi:hypothetical protein